MDVNRIRDEFIDERGSITRLFNIPGSQITAVLLIVSIEGTIRANHYHKRDTHYSYMLSGKMEYWEKPHLAKTQAISRLIMAGEMVKTSPGTIHAMKFIEDSVMIVFTTEPRDQERYEKDTVRVKLI